MSNTGIDVSYANGVINWQAVKNSRQVDFAILRCGYGCVLSQKDKQFEANYTGAKAAGIPVGVYHYSYAMNAADAVREAEACIEMIKGKQFEYPIYYDFEETNPKYNQQALPQATKVAIITAFCETLEKAGYWAGVYSFASMLNTLPATLTKRFAVWVAHTGVNKPSFAGDYGIWQYSHTGNAPGANTSAGSCDMNYGYVDYPTLIKAAGKNGFTKQAASTWNITFTGISTEAEAKTIAQHIAVIGYTAHTIEEVKSK